MTQTTARIKQSGKHFEILVDLEKAINFKKTGKGSDFLEIDKIFSDSKKGFTAKESDLKNSFGTDDIYEIAQKIVKSGEILLTQDFREEEKEKRIKQVVDFLSRNAINPQTRMPHTPERIKSALEQSHVNIKNVAIENQIQEIISEISKILPIKIETKKVKITIPAIHTGKAYGLVNQYKEEENWLSNGDLEIIASIPAGFIIDFYDKLNSATHGAILTEEMKE
ncbi:ribosome assembly factor SBDS [Candidatus Pacearchaeota archaeon]|nr:ribosome assembly factor SBDS [Candidatus Pacearchaeota archaeon]